MQPQKVRKLHVVDHLDPVLTMTGDPVYMQAVKRVGELRPVARRFIFDAEASRHVGTFIRDCPDMLYANRQFALPPYETTYIQLNLDQVLDALGRRKRDISDGRDIDTGYLIHRDEVFAFSRSVRGPGGLGYFGYKMRTPTAWCEGCRRFHKPIFDIPIYEGDEGDTFARSALLLGSTWHDLSDDEWRDFIHDVTVVLRLSKFVKESDDKKRERYRRLMLSAAGDYRILVTALLLLNQKQQVTYEHVPNSSGIIAGKRRVFHKHNRVTVHLGQHETVRRIFARTMYVPRRAHDVRAFFRHLGCQEGCIHEWPYLPEVSEDGIPRWTCEKCKGRRIRIKAHMRGTGHQGIVTKRYEVTE